MKVLMTTDTTGGVWTYTMELCANLQRYGIRIVLASMGGSVSCEQRRQVARLANVTFCASRYRLCWMQDPWEDVEAAGEWLRELEDQHAPDLIHLNDLAHGGLDWRAPVLLVGHSCVLSWWQAVKRDAAPAREWRRYRQAAEASVRQADLVVAPTSAMLEQLLHYYGPARGARRIHNGRDFPPALPAAEARRRRDEPVILAAGRLWDDAKNLSTLAGIAPDLSWPVAVAGAGTSPDGGGISLPGVRHLGLLPEDELAEWLFGAAIYVSPARYEPFGLGILEAARSGCALVLGDLPSLREVWGAAAEYVDPDDADALRQVLGRLIADPGRRQRLAARARRRANLYTASRMAAEYVKCYRFLRRTPAAVPARPVREHRTSA